MSEVVNIGMLPALIANDYRKNIKANKALKLEMSMAVDEHLDSLDRNSVFENPVYMNTNLDKLLTRNITIEPPSHRASEKSIAFKQDSYDIIIDDGSIHWSPLVSWEQKEAARIIDYFENHNYLQLYQNYIHANNTICDFAFLNTIGPVGVKVANNKRTSMSIYHRNSLSNLSCNTVIVDVGKNANALITEVFDCSNTALTKIIYIVRDNAKLHVDRYIKEGSTAHVIESTVVQFQRSSVNIDIKASSTDYCLQSFDVSSFHFCNTEISGIIKSGTDDSNIIITDIEHRGKNSTSAIDVRSVTDDTGMFSFKGGISILGDATDTVAHMQNKNIQLSNSAKVFTEPKLDIFTKEVECTHGCTVSNLDPQELYYLHSRGIDQQSAEKMLLNNFLGVTNYERLIPNFV